MPLTAAKLIGEIAGAQRFSSEAKLARAAAVAPIPVSSGKTNRHRLDRGGNRQINAALHRAIVTPTRCHPQTRDYIARRRSRRVWRLLQPPTSAQDIHTINFLT